LKQLKSSRSRPRKGTAAKAAFSEIRTAEHFPIAGFGASAGGLEAFITLLRQLNPNLGMAYVLIMHLSPHKKSSLREILQTKTKMKVHTVKNGLKIRPNNVYVIPPNTLMSLVNRHFELVPRSDVPSIGNFAVDYFLTALASGCKNNSIGIVLSGNATDGTLGLKAIKAEGGITFAQDDTAKFSGMPKSAFESGYADFRLSPENIAKELARLVKAPYTALPLEKIEEENKDDPNADTPVLKKILLIVKAKTGIDFFLHYKQAMIYRRVIRRVVLSKCLTLNDYCLMLESNGKEVLDLYNDFLINVTHFFRDPDFYKMLDCKIFPSIIKQGNPTNPIRIWVAGCATGEEAYSVAISMREFLEKNDLDVAFQIFASDLDSQAIEKARLGIYVSSVLQNVSQQRLNRFFRKIHNHYQIEKSIRETCVFSQHNLLKDPPFSRMDLISCQNVLIYLEADPQQLVLQTFHYALKPSGFLFLGKSETIGGAVELFEPLDKKVRVYARKSGSAPPVTFSNVKIRTAPPREKPPVEILPASDIEKDISKILLTRFVSPCIVLNQNLNIIQFFGITSPYLEPVVGKASLNILKMIREDLLIHVRALLLQARKTESIALKEGINISNKKEQREIAIEVIPRKSDKELFFLVVFKEGQNSRAQKGLKGKRSKKTPSQKEEIIARLENELIQSREVIKTTNEEFETTYEELQANNEEILSSNEELQSVNEEMETSKEELQSANEELTTINEELQKRNAELKESQNYAKAIVDTVNSPFLVLTSNLQVKSANKSFYNTFKLTPEKTEGSFIYELGNRAWDIPAFRGNLNELLGKKSNYLEFELRHFFSGVGELTITVNTYRLPSEDITKEFLILLAFMNISEVVKANKELKQLNEHLAEFTFGASHDLQEPLRKIRTFTNFLSGYENSDDYITRYVDKINGTAERMSTLMKGMLEYSFLLKNHRNKCQPVDLNETVKNVLADMDLVIDEKHAVVNIAPLPVVDAEPVLMYQLFYNVLKNALKFNNGKPIIDITVSKISPEDYDKHGLKKGRDYVSIMIKDNGVGFDQQYANQIFLMYRRLNDKRGEKGIGMGLAICKKIVEDLGGAIFAEGKRNEGATFFVLLPVPEAH
jgi:two-component system, chemotaxis family, CheB/CheR fusion protein